MTTDTQRRVLHEITHLHQNNGLDSKLTPEMLPALAESLTPHIDRYLAKFNSFPEGKLFRPIVNNYVKDGPWVETLSAVDSPGAGQSWNQLRETLLKTTRQKWTWLSSAYRDEIVDRALIRIERNLPSFLFMARFNTWVTTILIREYLRLEGKIKEEEERERSIDDPENNPEIPGPSPLPEDATEKGQVILELQQRIEALGKALDVKILRLHIAGYTLKEIKQQLGKNAPSISTIKRRKDRLLDRLKEDPVVQEIAQELGLLSDENGNKTVPE